MNLLKGYNTKVDDRFSIHIAEDNQEELNALVNLNVEIHNQVLLKSYIREIFMRHPRKDDILWLYIKDNEKNKLVSSICLVPLEWQINNTILPGCEMEFVGTHEDYRGRGYIKILNELYEKIMEQNGYIISVIRGIPYYYRSLGYEFVSSLDERIEIPVAKIPIRKIKLHIRKANSKDIPLIESRYNHFHKKFYIFNRFDKECFEFKYLRDNFNSEVRSSYIFEKRGISTNYFSIGMSYDNMNYEVFCPSNDKKEMLALLQFIKNLGRYSKQDNITLSINHHSPLFSYLKSLGGILVSDYGWQVKIPNLKLFFNLIKKIIEFRLEHSEYNEITKKVRLSNYLECIEIDFEKGKIKNIETIKGYQDTELIDLQLPGALIFKVVLGERNIDEINFLIKDAIVNPKSKDLINTIFPKKKILFDSYI